eukprot:3724566-Amphidinium_carterae.1
MTSHALFLLCPARVKTPHSPEHNLHKCTSVDMPVPGGSTTNMRHPSGSCAEHHLQDLMETTHARFVLLWHNVGESGQVYKNRICRLQRISSHWKLEHMHNF